MSEKITLRFETLNQDEDITFSEPITITNHVNIKEELPVDNVEENEVYLVKNNSHNKQYFIFIDGKWEEILIGSHSHHNKNLLDEFLNIDDININENSNIVLTLIKDEENVKFQWKEIPLKIEDEEIIIDEIEIPKQTFQHRTIVMSDWINENESTNELYIEDVTYDSSTDKMLIFDNGILIINEFTMETVNINYKKYLKLTFDEEIFDYDEISTVIIIKEGTKGFIDTAENEFMKKDDIIKYLSGNQDIILTEYIKQEELKTKADKIHTHNSYSYKSHNHDEFYSPLSHVHENYTTVEFVNSLINEYLASLNGVEINEEFINNNFSEIILEINKKIKNNLILEEKIKNIENNLNNFSIDLIFLDNQEDFKTDYENLKDMTATNNDEIEDLKKENQDIKTSIKYILNEDLPPLIKPDFTFEIIEDRLYEPGDINCKYTIKLNYIQNDGGKLKSAKIVYNQTDENGMITNSHHNFTDNEYSIPLDVVDGLIFDGLIVIEYENGVGRETMLGSEFISSGIIEKEIKIYGNRRSFIGKTDGNIRDCIISDIPLKNTTYLFQKEDLRKYFTFAFPRHTVNIKDIIYKEQNISILDLFEQSIKFINGSNNYGDSPYEVYQLYLENIEDDMHFEIILEEV